MSSPENSPEKQEGNFEYSQEQQAYDIALFRVYSSEFDNSDEFIGFVNGLVQEGYMSLEAATFYLLSIFEGTDD